MAEIGDLIVRLSMDVGGARKLLTSIESKSNILKTQDFFRNRKKFITK